MTICRKELNTYFNTPIGYVFLVIFSLFINFLFFYMQGFWEINRATLELFFLWVRIVFLFFIPAITMRLWAEEKKAGTVEILFTLPYRLEEIIIGKYLSATLFLFFALGTTIFLPISVGIVGDPDWAIIIGGYLATFLLGASYIAMGLYISWLTQDQIVAFLISVAASFLLFVMGYPKFLQIAGPLGPLFAFASISWHFESLAIGLFDTRNLLYFFTFIGLFLYLNYYSIGKQR